MGTLDEVAGKADSILGKVQVIVEGLSSARTGIDTLDTKLDDIRTFLEGLQNGGGSDQAKIDAAFNALTAAEGVVDSLSATVTDLSDRIGARVQEADTLDGTP